MVLHVALLRDCCSHRLGLAIYPVSSYTVLRFFKHTSCADVLTVHLHALGSMLKVGSSAGRLMVMSLL